MLEDIVFCAPDALDFQNDPRLIELLFKINRELISQHEKASPERRALLEALLKSIESNLPSLRTLYTQLFNPNHLIWQDGHSVEMIMMTEEAEA